MRKYLLALAPVVLAAVVALLVAGRAGATTCDPIQTPPHFRGQVPTPQQVLGYELGSQEATAAEINTYIGALDAASSRVVSGQFATSWEGRPLKYSIVGKPGNLTPSTLATIRANAAAPAQPADADGPSREPGRAFPGDPLARRERPRKRGVGGGRGPPHFVRARRS